MGEELARKFLGNSSSQALLNTVYFYNGKLFGLRSTEHRQTTLNNSEVGDNFIKFEENVSKTFHGGLTDLKYQSRVKILTRDLPGGNRSLRMNIEAQIMI